MPKKKEPGHRVADGVSDEKLIEAITESHGLISVAARRLGISRRTIHHRAEKSEAVREAIQEAREYTADVAESALFKSITKGEGWAVCFFLKCQGKARGYVERQEITGKDGGPVEVEDVHETRERIARRVAVIADRRRTNGRAPVTNGNGAHGP